jgi:hypothetical protein
MFLFSSCDFEFDLNLIPDIDEIVSGTYTVDIDSDLTTGSTHTDSVDLTQYEEYEEYKDIIISYEITKLTCEIVAFEAPEDLWFSGKVIAHDMDSTLSVEIASFDAIHLHTVYSDTLEVELIEDQTGLDQVALWMEDPGKFKYYVEYQFVNEDKTPYIFEEEDYGGFFDLKINFSLLLETKG